MKKTEELGIKYYKEQLKNGSNIFLYERKGFPINIRVIFDAGARFGIKPGISHFLEHMLVAGSKKYPTKDSLCTPLENIGGSIRAMTGNDFLYINVNIADIEDIDIAVNTLNESINNSLFDDKTIENERKAIISEIGNKISNPASNVFDIAKKIFFQNTILENSGLGTSEIVLSTTKDELIHEYVRLIKQSKPTIIVSGDIDIEILKIKFDPIFTGTNDLFNSLIGKNLPIIKNKRIEIEKYASNQTHIRLGFRTDIHLNKDYLPAYILSSLLAQGRTSVLVSELRYKQGLVYNVGGTSNYMADYSWWTINTSTEKKNVQKVIDIILSEIDKIKNNGITEDQLDFVKSKEIKSIKFSLQTSSLLVDSSIVDTMLNQEKPYFIDDFVSGIEKITTKDILESAQKIFDKDNLFIAICGDIDQNDLKINF